MLIIAFRPGNRIGWLCGAIGVTFSFAQCTGVYADCAISGATALPVVPLMAWLAYLAFPTTILMMFSLLPFLFPDGPFFSPAWRRLALITTGVVVASLLGAALVRGPLVHSGTDTTYTVVNPVGLLPATLGPLFEDLMLLAIVGATLAGIASLVVRLRRSRGAMRQQLKLLVYFLVVAIAVQLAIELVR